jgi:GT2 family glycosyltransferase
MKVSVIVPTYQDWDRLVLCIEALKKQTFPQEKVEVIIINNDTDDEFRKLDLPSNYILINEERPGSYAARNAGLKIADGEIVAFTDSDCVPDTKWIEMAVKRLEGGAERVAGHVELSFQSEKLTWADIYEKAYAFNQNENAKKGVSITANMITWRSHFDHIGMFDDTLMSGGDIEWARRAYDKGISIVYAPDVIVYHPSRDKLSVLLKKARRVAIGSATIENTNIAQVITRGFFPPVHSIPLLNERKVLTKLEKLIAFIVAWFIKVYSSSIKLLYLLGYVKQKRA